VAPVGLTAAIDRARRSFEMVGAKYALVGGLAVSARAEPRTTRDVDFAVAVNNDLEAESVIAAMVGLGYAIHTSIEHTTSSRLATVRLLHREQPRIFVDVLFASCGIEPEIVAAAEALPLLAMPPIPVATVAHLIAMKVLARDDRKRPQDWDDLRGLIAVATPADLKSADLAVELIEDRNFARNRSLRRLLADAIGEFGE
jgi:predicted nucleotidyltransferase